MTDLNPNSDSPTTDDPALSDRIRTSFALAQTRISSVPSLARARLTARVPSQLIALPDQIRDAVDRALDGARDRLRDSLDLPSREDLSVLLERVEAMDQKLAALENGKAPKKNSAAKKTPAKKTTKKTAGKSNSVNKDARRAAIAKAAKKPASKAGKTSTRKKK